MEPGEPIHTPKNSFWEELLEWVKVLVIAAAISLPIRFFIVEPFIVDGASMDPTFDTGQFMLVDRLSYRFEDPSRQDVIVFRYPNNPKQFYIKRIIGLPGETLDIRDGLVKVTNSAGDVSQASTTGDTTVMEPYIDPKHRSHETTQVTLGQDEYFVMGDNRLESSDSRVWGPLNRKLIIGRPLIRILPLNTLSIFPGEYTQP